MPAADDGFTGLRMFEEWIGFGVWIGGEENGRGHGWLLMRLIPYRALRLVWCFCRLSFEHIEDFLEVVGRHDGEPRDACRRAEGCDKL